MSSGGDNKVSEKKNNISSVEQLAEEELVDIQKQVIDLSSKISEIEKRLHKLESKDV